MRETDPQVELGFELVANMRARNMSVSSCTSGCWPSWCSTASATPGTPRAQPGSRFHAPWYPRPRLSAPFHLHPRAAPQRGAAADRPGLRALRPLGAARRAAFSPHSRARRTGLPGSTAAGGAGPPLMDLLGGGSGVGSGVGPDDAHWSARLASTEAVNSGLKPRAWTDGPHPGVPALAVQGSAGATDGLVNPLAAGEAVRGGGFGGRGGGVGSPFPPQVPLELTRSMPFLLTGPSMVAHSRSELPFSPRSGLSQSSSGRGHQPGHPAQLLPGRPGRPGPARLGPSLAEAYLLFVLQMLERRCANCDTCQSTIMRRIV
jgi:hypothetical protein